MITPFGKMLREIRTKNGILMKDMALLFKVTPSFVSSVETGRKNVPKDWIDVIANNYDLTDAEIAKLRMAASQSANTLRIDVSNASIAQRGAALSFARNFGNISDETAEQIAALIKKR